MLEDRKRLTMERQREEIQNALDEMDEDAGWTPELQLITQMVFYVKKLVDRYNQITSVKKEEADPEEENHNNNNRSYIIGNEPDGMVAMLPKKER